MAGPRCKAILNGIIGGLTQALEKVLTDGDMMYGVDIAKGEDWLQRLASCDLAVYRGDSKLLPVGGLAQIVLEMQKAGLVTDEVWYVLRHPEGNQLMKE